MDFELTDDQVALQEGVRHLAQGRFPIDTVRGMETSGGVDRKLWGELAEAGVFCLCVPEGGGGVGLGMAESVLVFEELGKSLVPGPLVATALAAELVPGAATGEEVVTLIEPGHEPVLVEHLDVADRVLVLGVDGIRSVHPSELAGKPVERPTDPLTPVSLVGTIPAGERLAGPDEAAALRRKGTVMTAALQLGLASAVTTLAVEYARDRQQFGRPIAGFQAVKHILADMAVRAEVARAAVYAAGVTLDDPTVGDPDRATSVAKLTAGDAAIRNGKGAIQVHGGMGFTWEVDAHLFLKRAWALDTAFGSVEHHAALMADRLTPNG